MTVYKTSYHIQADFFDGIEEDIPERNMLVALLERSIRDLELDHRLHIKASIAWFRGFSPTEGITFQYVCDYLDLTQEQINSIMIRVNLAEKYLEDPNTTRSVEKNNQRQIKHLSRRSVRYSLR